MNMQNHRGLFWVSDYELIEKNENTIEIRILKSFTITDIISFLVYCIVLFFSYRLLLNKDFAVIDKKATYVISLSISILFYIVFSFLVRLLRKNNIIFKYDSLIFDKDTGLFFKNNKEICPHSEISRVEIYTHNDFEDTTIYYLFLILKDENRIEISSSDNFELMCDIADEIADFIDLTVHID